MSEAEEILSRLESGTRSYRWSFCFAIAGLAMLTVANVKWGVPAIIRTKAMEVVDDHGQVLGFAKTRRGESLIATLKGSKDLAVIGKGNAGAGGLALCGPTGEPVISMGDTNDSGGHLLLKGASGKEILNFRPNDSSTGSINIDNSAGSEIGGINGDKQNGGVIIVKDSVGKETARIGGIYK